MAVLNTIRVSWKLENTENSRNLWQDAPTVSTEWIRQSSVCSSKSRIFYFYISCHSEFFELEYQSLGSPQVAQHLALESKQATNDAIWA